MESRGIGSLLAVGILAAVAAGGTVAAQSAPPASAEPVVPVRISFLKGSSALPIVVMQSQDLPAKYGLDVEWQEFVEVDALNTATTIGQTDINTAFSVDSLAFARNANRDVVAIYSGLRNHISIIAPTDSGIAALCDLNGKRLAVSDANDAVLAYFATNDCNMTMGVDVQQIPGPPPVVGTLLGGEADAVRNFEPFQSQLLTSGTNTEIWRETDAWRDAFGQDLLLTTLSVQGPFATANPETVRRVVAMYKEAVDWAQANPDEVLPMYGTYVGIEDPAVLELLAERLLPGYLTQWDEPMIESLDQLLTVLLESGAIETIPEGMFSLDFVPPA
jgi:ABC-type nitrate/sulfonate/bicarbonate transport system substrate-binding protein